MLKHLVHVQDGVDLHLDGRLALADFLQHVHHKLQPLERRDRAPELRRRRAHVLAQVDHRAARLLVELVRVLYLPLRSLVLELQLQFFVLSERANVVQHDDGFNFVLHGDKRLARSRSARSAVCAP